MHKDTLTARQETAIKLGDAEIERIIADDLTRGQIKTVFGVGEHAAQLARTTAVATRRERARAGSMDISALRDVAEEYFAHRSGLPDVPALGTDRSKVTQFLDWLETRYTG